MRSTIRNSFFTFRIFIAERLRQNQRFDEAIRWLKYIFDPTNDTKEEAPPERYWKYVPFKTSPRDSIQKLMPRWNPATNSTRS